MKIRRISFKTLNNQVRKLTEISERMVLFAKFPPRRITYLKLEENVNKIVMKGPVQ